MKLKIDALLVPFDLHASGPSLVIGVAGIFINASTTQDLCIAHPLSMSCDYPLEVFHEGLPEIPNGAPPTSPHSLIVAAASAAAATSVIVKSGNR